MKEIVEQLKQAPEGQLDPSMKPLVEKWSDPPKAVEVLEVLDKCVHGSLASSFIMQLLQVVYDDALHTEGRKHFDVVKEATWR